VAWLPKSKKAQRRLVMVAVAGVFLAGAVGLVLYGLRDSVSMFYTPSQAAKANPPAGRRVQLGGMVAAGSLHTYQDGTIDFLVADSVSSAKVVYKGELPPLFREGQGTVVKGAFEQGGVFRATEVLAKHDENYMPRELTKALKDSGEWQRGQGAPPQPETKAPAKLDPFKVSS